MATYIEKDLKTYEGNLFKMLEKDWTAITVAYEDKINSMTASCGSFGNIYPFGDCAFIAVRPQRYTHELLQKASTFSLSFFTPEYRKILSYFGKVSGYTEDKIKHSGLTVLHDQIAPYFAEAQTTLLCEKIIMQPLDKKSFVKPDQNKDFYPDNDYHILYVGAIKKILVKN